MLADSMTSGIDFDSVTATDVMDDFDLFCKVSGIRESQLTDALMGSVDTLMLETPLQCVAYSTPPQEGKTTWIIHFIV